MYLLLQPQSTSTPANFIHPTIEYHFADDPSSALLPTSEKENVIILDYQGPDSTPIAQSLHPELAISGVRVADTPGSSSAPRDSDMVQNNMIYIVEIVNASINALPGRER